MTLSLSVTAIASTPLDQPHTAVVDAYPSLSPDDRQLLFQSNRSGRWALYIAKADGADARVFLDSGDDPVSPAWSPDGALIAYAATVEGQSEIFVIKADGTGRRRMTFDPGDDSHPHWSRDNRLFFNSGRATPDQPSDPNIEVGEIFSMKPDGSDLRQHTHCHALCTFPSPSPDGTKIAYRKVLQEPGKNWMQQDQALNSEVFVADLDGGHERNLSASPAYDGWPVWSPDSRWIAFSSNRGGVPAVGQIFELHPDGKGLRQVTQGLQSHVQASYAGRSQYGGCCL